MAGSADPQAVDFLAMALADADDVIARDAAEALARKRTPEALQWLTRQVRESLVLRSIAGGATGRWRFESEVKALAESGRWPEVICLLQVRPAEPPP